jgi:hypothetical protein
MLLFPQLSTGATAQYPIRRRRSERTILNLSDDGSVIALWDQSASQVKWDLQYTGLTDAEVANLVSFYELCEGPLQSFLFLDPASNLFSYSEDFTQPAWQANSLLALTAGFNDPYNTNRATQVWNTSLGELSLTQTVEIPGSVSSAFSVYARANQPSNATLTKTDGSTLQSTVLQVSSAWTRFSLNSAFASSISTSCNFSILLQPGQSIDLFGFQLEPQPLPGTYIMNSSQTGLYPNTRFNGNGITVVSTGPGESSLAISLISPSTQ